MKGMTAVLLCGLVLSSTAAASEPDVIGFPRVEVPPQHAHAAAAVGAVAVGGSVAGLAVAFFFVHEAGPLSWGLAPLGIFVATTLAAKAFMDPLAAVLCGTSASLGGLLGAGAVGGAALAAVALVQAVAPPADTPAFRDHDTLMATGVVTAAALGLAAGAAAGGAGATLLFLPAPEE